MLFLLACSQQPPPVAAPEIHGWADEARLVDDGLTEVERLFKSGQKEAARTLAERVYTERWEPRLEPVAERVAGPGESARIEYAFGQLLVELEGNGARLGERVDKLQEDVKSVADAAARAFPPPSEAGAPPPPPPPTGGSKPIVPEAKPNWETDPGAATRPVDVPR